MAKYVSSSPPDIHLFSKAVLATVRHKRPVGPHPWRVLRGIRLREWTTEPGAGEGSEHVMGSERRCGTTRDLEGTRGGGPARECARGRRAAPPARPSGGCRLAAPERASGRTHSRAPRGPSLCWAHCPKLYRPCPRGQASGSSRRGRRCEPRALTPAAPGPLVPRGPDPAYPPSMACSQVPEVGFGWATGLTPRPGGWGPDGRGHVRPAPPRGAFQGFAV